MRRLLLFVLLILCAGPAWAGPRVQVAQGVLEGVQVGRTAVFRRIPYAAPPARWTSPQPPAAWTGVRRADTFGPVAVQPASPWQDERRWTGSEDCLTLNVYAPLSAAHLPVVVVLGSRADLVRLDGRSLCERGPALVVTVGYRLGVFGFPGGDDYGLQDVRAALGWLQANVAAFGGDPQQVLLYGDGAGAVVAQALLLDRLHAGLFSTVFLDSPYPPPAAPPVDRPRWRDVPPYDLAAAVGDARGPAVDPAGPPLPVPVVVASTRDEMATLLVWQGRLPAYNVDPPDYRRAVARLEGAGRAPAILRLYPLYDYYSPTDALVAMETDAVFNSPMRRLSRTLSARTDVYRCVFAHPWDAGPLQDRGAAHAVDVPYWLGAMPPHATPRERALSARMQACLVRVAGGMPPAADGWPRWNRYTARDGVFLRIDISTAAASRLRSGQCDWWDSLGRNVSPGAQ